jgi:hypothetical protein
MSQDPVSADATSPRIRITMPIPTDAAVVRRISRRCWIIEASARYRCAACQSQAAVATNPTISTSAAQITECTYPGVNVTNFKDRGATPALASFCLTATLNAAACQVASRCTRSARSRRSARPACGGPGPWCGGFAAGLLVQQPQRAPERRLAVHRSLSRAALLSGFAVTVLGAAGCSGTFAGRLRRARLRTCVTGLD